MSRGRHAKPSNAGRYARTAALTTTSGAALVGLLPLTAVAHEPAPAPPAASEEATVPAPEPITDVIPITVVVQSGDYLSKLAPQVGAASWQDLYAQNTEVVGADPDFILPGQELTYVAGLVLPGGAPVRVEEQASGTEQVEVVPEETVAASEAATPAFGTATIINSAGPVSIRAQEAADRVFANVRGASLITIGGTRPSARDMNGHPSGNALDYMVLGDTPLGDAIAQYHRDHWDELGVEYMIWQQRIMYSPQSGWERMPDRGSPTQNHMDHPHVNYRP